jgi:uncharacterized membrane protein
MPSPVSAKHFKESWNSVWVILLGAIISSVIFILGVYFGYDYAPFAITCLFAGVIFGSCPIVTKELKGEKMNAKGILLDRRWPCRCRRNRHFVGLRQALLERRPQ